MIPAAPTAAAPVTPAGRDFSLLLRRAGASRLFLRRSMLLQAVLAGAVGAAALACYAALAPRLGVWLALPPALALLAAGGLAAAAWRRRQPVVIEIGPDTLAAWSYDGACVAQGRLAGGAQWGGALLALALEANGRRTTLLVAADALAADAFRTLAVRARCAAGR